MKDLNFAVIGAGHGGKALAAHLAIKGFSVNLYNRTLSRIKPIIKMKGIELEGEVKGFGRLGCVTDDIEKAISGIDVIMIVVPANGHSPIAEIYEQLTKKYHTMKLKRARTGGKLELSQVIRETNNHVEVNMTEHQT